VLSGKVNDDIVVEENERSDIPMAVGDDQLSAVMSADRTYSLERRVQHLPSGIVADLFQTPW
jgi:hypothetical protein